MAESHAHFRPGEVLGNRYRIDALLGRGGMGAAYAATNLVTGKRVAVKWLLREQSASALHRAVREARAACRVRHPNIVDVYDVGEHEGSLFLVMELLSGRSLQSVIHARAPLPLGELLAWLLPAFRGLRELHRSGVIHRDLKPANIFLCQSAPNEPIVAKLLDFGVSKIISSGSESSDGDASLTDSGALVGTPSYMAPEQLQEAHRVDARADVYACGAVLYHALSGRKPFEGEGYAAIVAKALSVSPPPLCDLCPELPGELCGLVDRTLERDPERRLQSIEELIRGLEPHCPADARLTDEDQRSSRARPGGLRWAVAALIAAVLASAWGFTRQALTRAPQAQRAALPDVEPVREPSDRTWARSEFSPERLMNAPAKGAEHPKADEPTPLPPPQPEHRVLRRREPAALRSGERVSAPAERHTAEGKPIIELSEEDF